MEYVAGPECRKVAVFYGKNCLFLFQSPEAEKACVLVA